MIWTPWRKPDTDLPAARRAVEDAKKEWPRVHRIHKRASEQKEQNGFGRLIFKAMGGEDR